MSCAACSSRVEKAVSKVPGVTSCSVSLLTNSMGVDGTASAQEIIQAVEQAGYGASEKGAANQPAPSMQGGRKAARGPRNAEAQAETLLVTRVSSRAHVFFDGAHDVGLAAAELLRRQPRGDGPDAAFAHGHHHGHQPALFHQRLQGPLAPRAQYGHARRPRLDRRICLQHLRPLRHDRRAGPGRYGRGHELHDGLLL